MDDLDQLITSCGESTYAAELQLWVALNDQIKPYFTRKVTVRFIIHMFIGKIPFLSNRVASGSGGQETHNCKQTVGDVRCRLD